MNCKINRTTNNMADVYGPEFNLTTEEIINTIRRTYQIQSIGPGFNPIDVEVTLYNNDYYVRPGDAKHRFIKEFEKIFSGANQLIKDCGDNLAHLCTIIQILGLIKEYFDEAYFEEQINRRKEPINSAVTKERLKKLLKKCNKDKFELFFITVIGCRLQHGLFMTDVNSANLWMKIRESCRAAGVEVPEDTYGTEFKDFLSNNRGYYFNILSTKALANMLCDAIDLDVELAISAAHKLYNYGIDAMSDCIKREINSKIRA